MAALACALLAFALSAVNHVDVPFGHGAERRAEHVAGLSQARVFIPDGAGAWLQPLPLYTTRVAAALGAGDPVRAASMAIAALDVALLFLLANVLFNDARVALASAALLALAPAHLVLARSAAESVFIVPFVLAWCVCLVSALKTQQLVWAMLAGSALGFGFFAAPTGPITVTLLAGLTAATMWGLPRRLQAIAAVAGAMGFVVGAAVIVGLRIDHAPLVETIGRWWIHPAHVVNPIEGLQSIVNRTSASVRVGRYWHVLNPIELFLPGASGAAPPFFGHAPFGLGYLLLLLLGVQWSGQQRPTEWRVIAIATLLVPIAAVTFDDVTIADVAPIVPLLVLWSAGGVAQCLAAPSAWTTAVAALSGLAIVAQSAWWLL